MAFKHNIAVRFSMPHADHYEGFTGGGLTKEGARRDAEQQAWSKSDILNIRHHSAIASFLTSENFQALDWEIKQRIKNDWNE